MRETISRRQGLFTRIKNFINDIISFFLSLFKLSEPRHVPKISFKVLEAKWPKDGEFIAHTSRVTHPCNLFHYPGYENSPQNKKYKILREFVYKNQRRFFSTIAYFQDPVWKPGALMQTLDQICEQMDICFNGFNIAGDLSLEEFKLLLEGQASLLVYKKISQKLLKFFISIPPGKLPKTFNAGDSSPELIYNFCLMPQVFFVRVNDIKLAGLPNQFGICYLNSAIEYMRLNILSEISRGNIPSKTQHPAAYLMYKLVKGLGEGRLGFREIHKILVKLQKVCGFRFQFNTGADPNETCELIKNTLKREGYYFIHTLSTIEISPFGDFGRQISSSKLDVSKTTASFDVKLSFPAKNLRPVSLFENSSNAIGAAPGRNRPPMAFELNGEEFRISSAVVQHVHVFEWEYEGYTLCRPYSNTSEVWVYLIDKEGTKIRVPTGDFISKYGEGPLHPRFGTDQNGLLIQLDEYDRIIRRFDMVETQKRLKFHVYTITADPKLGCFILNDGQFFKITPEEFAENLNDAIRVSFVNPEIVKTPTSFSFNEHDERKWQRAKREQELSKLLKSRSH